MAEALPTPTPILQGIYHTIEVSRMCQRRADGWEGQKARRWAEVLESEVWGQLELGGEWEHANNWS